ncbi:protein of unknown function (DUF4342) [Fodinibius salinus]|uniref:DUF4342 domain-containing protein n=1 Tax=Fodinibius salinus TaxID=860790 RepID=A0A5D3YJK4_9BACT|nr:DUF4342 domain-containing protein [Fodinibius salinus]TYP94024.1 protein of unknown function (DUF4342) [Fodinibius salinus]
MESSNSRKTFSQELQGTITEIISQVKRLIKEGNARRVIIEDKNGKVLFQTQLTIGVGGAAVLTTIAPVVSAISMFALFMNDVKIIVERYENGDEYEVEADFIEIRDEDEENDTSSAAQEDDEEINKTIGKDSEE